jgi:hypothetical protein
MELLPLSPVAAGSSASSIIVTCCSCDTQARYADATALNWKFDPAGTPFVAYYCPRCARA